MSTDRSCMIEVLALVLAFVHVQNRFLGRSGSQEDGAQCRIVRRRKDNEMEYRLLDYKFGISFE